MQSVVFASVVRWAAAGDTSYYDEMLSLYNVRSPSPLLLSVHAMAPSTIAALQGTTVASLKNRFAGALASPRDVGLLQQTLAYAIDPSVVRPQVCGPRSPRRSTSSSRGCAGPHSPPRPALPARTP